MSTEPLRIGLNASALLFPLTGIGQYTKNLAEALVASGEVELHLFYVAAWSREIRTEPLKTLTKLKSAKCKMQSAKRKMIGRSP